ncbi:MAG: AsmA-like C-terminal region-containing protein [Xanthomonadales bacterium]|jgi:uncharacterized protein involved in outer membrane biogenesis|nr:AsmA-like C-terminal region-containing protein [Xanthomonadales bacterium]
MSLKKLVLWIFALTISLVGGLLVWAFNADLGRFQPQIEAALTKQLGRETRFDDLNIDLGSSIEVRASGFRIANLPGANPDDLLQVPSFEGAVRLASLFGDGPLVIERLEADGVQLNLAWDGNGNGNFQLGAPTAATPTAEEPPLQQRLSLGQSRIGDATVTLAWPGHENRLEIRNLEVADGAEDMITISLDGAVNGKSMGFSGQVGPRQGLLNAGAVTIEGKGNFSTLLVDGKAEIDNLERPDRPIVRLDIRGNDIRDVEAFLGLEEGPAGSYQLLLDSKQAQDRWTVDLRGHIGESTFDAEGEASGLRDLSRVGLNVNARGPDLGNVLRLFRLDDFQEEPFEVRGRVLRDGSDLKLQEIHMDIGSTRFDLDGTLGDFPHLQDAQVALEVRGDDIESFRGLLGLPGAADGPFSLELTFEPGAGQGPGSDSYDLMSAELRTNLGTLGLKGNVSDDARYAGSTLAIDFDGTNALDSLGDFGLPGLEPSPYAVDARVEIREQGVFIEQGQVTGLYAMDATASGLVGWQPLDAVTNIDIELDGADLAGTLVPLGIEWPLASAPFRLTSGLRATASGLRFDDLVLQVAQSRLEGDALVPLVDDLSGLDATLQAEGPELTNIFRPGDAMDVPPGAWSLATHLRRVNSHLVMENTRITLADVELTGEVTLPWPVQAGNGAFTLEGRGQDITTVLPRMDDFAFAPQAFTISAEAAVEEGTWRFRPSSVQLGSASLTITGTADQTSGNARSNLDLDLEIPSLAALGTWQGERLSDARVALTTRLDGTRDRLEARPLELTAADSTATGSLVWDTSGAVPLLDLSLTSERFDLRPLLPAPEPESPDAAPETPPSRDQRLIPDTPLPLDWLDALEATMVLEIGQVIMHDRLVNDLSVAASLRASLLTLERYRVKGKTGEFDITGQLQRRSDGKAEVTLDLDAKDLLPAREDWQNADPATLPQIDALADVRAVGATPRELAASLNGRLRATATEGVLPGNGLGALNTYFLEQLLAILVPGLKAKGPTTLQCFAANILISDGIVTPEPVLALRTDKLLILAAGSVDLGSEKLDLQFQTTPSKLLGSSLMELVNPFVSLEGTLAKPSPVLDPGRTLFYGGAAAATGGLSIIAKGLWDRLRGAQKPCEQLRDALEEEARKEGLR